MSFRLMIFALSLLMAATGAFAQNDRERARREVEAQMREMVKIPAPHVVIMFSPLEQGQFKLIEADFVLNGVKISAPDVATLSGLGDQKVFDGDVKEGKNTLECTVLYEDSASVMMSESGGFRFKLPTKAEFEGSPGLSLRIVVQPQMHQPKAKDFKNRFRLTASVSAEMIAKVEDGYVPPPVSKGASLATAEKAGKNKSKKGKPQVERQETQVAARAPAEEFVEPPVKSKSKRKRASQTTDGLANDEPITLGQKSSRAEEKRFIDSTPKTPKDSDSTPPAELAVVPVVDAGAERVAEKLTPPVGAGAGAGEETQAVDIDAGTVGAPEGAVHVADVANTKVASEPTVVAKPVPSSDMPWEYIAGAIALFAAFAAIIFFRRSKS